MALVGRELSLPPSIIGAPEDIGMCEVGLLRGSQCVREEFSNRYRAGNMFSLVIALSIKEPERLNSSYSL